MQGTYYDIPQDYASEYASDPTRTGGPTGIPDPSNPGYDTGGYPLSNGTPGPVAQQGTGPQPFLPTDDYSRLAQGGQRVSLPIDRTADATTGGGGGDATAGGLGAGALANFGEAAPGFPSEPAFTPSTFTAPSMADALANPGYQFRVQQGRDQLQNWAAARGTLNDSGTAKSLIDYGQSAAEQGYGEVYARNFNDWQANTGAQERAYGLNRQSQYIDPYTAAYNAWQQRGNWYLQNQGTVAGTALNFASLV